jgi:hypothetical protein
MYDRFSKETEISVSAPEYEKGQVETLGKLDLISISDVSSLSGWSYLVRPTYEGSQYYVKKEKAKREENRHKAIEIIKFAIPTIISLIALLVSIFKK